MSVLKLVKAVTDFCFADPVKKLVQTESVADQIRGEQMLAIRKTTPSMLLVSMINVLLTGLVLWNGANRVVLAAWVGASLMLLLMGAIRAAPKKGRGLRARPTKNTNKAVINALVMGAIWAIMPVLFFADASVVQKVFITCVVAGMMGGAAIALLMLPSAAGVVCITIGAGALITLGSSGNVILQLACVMLFLFGYAMIKTVRDQGILYVQGKLDELKIAESGQTIALLLKEFEEHSSDWMWETDADGFFSSPSERFVQASDRSEVQLSMSKLTDLVAELPAEERRRAKMLGKSALADLIEQQRGFREITFRIQCGSELRWWTCSGHAVFGSHGEFQGYRGVASDVSETKTSELKLAHMARYDHLTGLANRSEFTQRLVEAISQVESSSGFVAVLYLDLDKFKSINDTLGHSTGDEVLAEAARRISGQLGSNDMAARFGGDEFAIVAHCPHGLDDAIRMGECILTALEAPFELDGHRMAIGTSIGIAMCNSHSDPAEKLIHNADLALYRAKAEGRGIFKVFAEHMDLAMRERRAMEIELRSAVANNQLELYYQPLADISSGTVIGFEALLRWNNPMRGQVPPDKFISLAEDVGLIHEIGDWVIGQACKDAMSWPGDQKVAVNLSGKQLQSYRLVQRVIEALAQTGLPPSRLELEVTESVLIQDPEKTIRLLKNLRELGVLISLDDFGTGYSSLSYLVRFPFDKLKIDKSFVQSAHESPENLAIVRSILSLARDLNITTLAEGIESQAHIDLLRQEGCNQIQGFLLDRPQPAGKLSEFSNYNVGDGATDGRSRILKMQERLEQLKTEQRIAS